MRILITGGAGFIGSHLAASLRDVEHEVRVIDNLSTGFKKNLDGLDVAFSEASILDEGQLDAATSGVDAVVHLAALGSVPRSIANPMATHDCNATGTLKVLESARAHGVKQVIVASSSSVYGLNPALPKSEREWVRPMSPYAVSKLATEQYALSYQQSFGLDTLAFRFFNVYGPRQRAGHAYAAVIPTWIDAVMREEPIWINGDGTTSRDFTYVGTVVSVIRDALERGVTAAEPVNLAFGTNTTLTRLARLIDEMSDEPARIEHRDPRPGDVKHSQADNQSLLSLFPSVEPVALTVGLRATLDWFAADMTDRAAGAQ